MKKLVCVLSCAVLAGVILWSGNDSHQASDYMGPGPMSIGKPVAVVETPEPHGIVAFKG